MGATRKRLNVLHVATINKPITSHMGYGPIETVIYNIDKGLSTLGHRSIVACSSDSAVTGQKYGTIPRDRLLGLAAAKSSFPLIPNGKRLQ